LVSIIAIETAPGHGNASTGVITAPGGWNLLSENVSTSGTDLQLRIYYKDAVAADVGGFGTYSWTFSDTFRAAAQMENFTNIGATPFESTTANCTATATSATITAPGFITGKGNDLNVALWVIAAHDAITPTNGSYNFNAGVGPTGVGPLPGFGTLAVPTSGTNTGSQTATGVPTAADNIGCQFNLSSTP
jgi:hypothetical protein